mmetsp:Transcript_43561/g.57675  ORF Transcript_43561/g.57675 Transcript_43561/m.57675 type:complete len:121 (+) Transcript_43561:853-1215(+)|eukprot:CAMPEP_0185568562 /NCGR_PEP_ID=MMETSP0434-20130131/1486_1 /TAXON_ID=626734 ORGANISM="Favella taraikaensis, Strain Fe Narragansett Bay" /NCGR_SAMPLE_ID=MMETSP0434 /ASSEMBLY_ACC=CAM_ASM_000379 /LENGTH=120 /DNA_ID=CAMNT_0028183123 /DNA_START=759 /DNA_END=1121 /DNA_ORIENTATION=-
MSLKMQLRSLFTVYKRSLLIGCSLLGLQQLIGINTAMYYGPLIMQKSGIKIDNLSKEESGLVLNIPLAFCNFIGTTISVFVIDRVGRRSILLITLPMMTACWVAAAMGMSFTSPNQSESA